ncbi:MAG: helix-turn-helix domain-containing protein, partial [Clostridia bacterium]|nr:helix-turn-helix domain-containing protein [Clostridia bacterium]
MQNYTDEQLAELSQNGDKTAQEALLKRYQKMVRACSRKFFLHGGEPEDLVQEGMIGLTLAIGAYNVADGASFKNFAYRCVWCRIVDVVKAAANSKNEALNNSVQFSIGDKLMATD